MGSDPAGLTPCRELSFFFPRRLSRLMSGRPCPVPRCGLRNTRGRAMGSDPQGLTPARSHLAAYKVPHHVVFTELPKTSTGKIQKFALRERAKGA